MEYNLTGVVATLPKRVRQELDIILAARCESARSLSEIRLMRGRGTSVIIGGRRVSLYSFVSGEEIAESLCRVCGGSLYAHLSTLACGYVALADGVRVGVCGRARYDRETLVGIDEVGSLIYRLATADSSFTRELCEAFHTSRRGMLVYSRAGGGKTTALRSLAAALAREGTVGNIAVVDERCEFSALECANLGVAHLRGYRRSLGAEIALRTLGAHVIVVDELASSGESYEVRQFVDSGVRLVASAHADSLDELLGKAGLSVFFESGIFDVAFGIFNTDGHYRCKIDKI